MKPPTNRAGLLSGARRIRRGAAVAALFLSVIGPTAAQAPADAGAAKAAPPDPAADLAVRRDSTASELEALSKTITLSRDRSEALEKTIAEIDKSNETLRDALVDSAAKRQEFERRISDGERTLGDLRVKEDVVRRSLRARRGLLAEVLAALQRMGRNPPPAILVTPEDALGSVRSAILLGAVVPEIREQTDSLVADLKALADIRSGIAREREELTAAMTARLEEERRMSMLVAEKEKLRQRNAADLAAEQRKAEELALQAENLGGLISSLENEISSVREAAAAARAEEEERRRMSEAEREAARELARSAVPDKNRIAPAYVFSVAAGAAGLSRCGFACAPFWRRGRNRAFAAGDHARDQCRRAGDHAGGRVDRLCREFPQLRADDHSQCRRRVSYRARRHGERQRPAGAIRRGRGAGGGDGCKKSGECGGLGAGNRQANALH